MRLIVLCVLVLTAAALEAHPKAAHHDADDKPIQETVFERWCRQGEAKSAYEEALSDLKNKEEVYNKAANVTKHVLAKYEKIADHHDVHKSSTMKIQHHIKVVEKRMKRLEKKKSSIKARLHPKFDQINWELEKGVTGGVIAAANKIHDKTTRELIKSTAKAYIDLINKTQKKIAKIEAKTETLLKKKRTHGTSLSNLSSVSGRVTEHHKAAKKKFKEAKKVSDVAAKDYKKSKRKYLIKAAHLNACVNKGYLPAHVAVDAMKHVKEIRAISHGAFKDKPKKKKGKSRKGKKASKRSRRGKSRKGRKARKANKTSKRKANKTGKRRANKTSTPKRKSKARGKGKKGKGKKGKGKKGKKGKKPAPAPAPTPTPAPSPAPTPAPVPSPSPAPTPSPVSTPDTTPGSTPASDSPGSAPAPAPAPEPAPAPGEDNPTGSSGGDNSGGQ
jgi:hypothetical protein